MKKIIIFSLLFIGSVMLYAEDGYDLWLRAKKGANAQVTANKQGATVDIALEELRTQWKGSPVQLNIV
ncbi:MAG: alpha-glucuronidase, partial [Prevotellaceae bacterium]|nr:alpha-glucuronidase [Prevotellaceae bacterium]